MESLQRIIITGIIALSAAACSSAPDGALPRAERTDINTSVFDSVFFWGDCRGTDEIHGMVVVKDGAVIYENYTTGHSAEELHVCWSASKTFTATAVGFAVQDGLLSVDDPVTKFFPEVVNPDPRMEKLTVKNLLIMSSGLPDALGEKYRTKTDPQVSKYILEQDFHFTPGEAWEYNSGNTYICSAIVTRVTGKKVEDYLKEKLFDKIGILDYEWEVSAEGCNMGGWGLHTTTENLAKMGLWMLQRGEWNGEQILNREWFDEAMSVQMLQYKAELDGTNDGQLMEKYKGNESRQGYGYQMWRCSIGEDVFRLDGAHGQYSIIIPEKNAVVAVTANARDTHAILRDVWKYVYAEL